MSTEIEEDADAENESIRKSRQTMHTVNIGHIDLDYDIASNYE